MCRILSIEPLPLDANETDVERFFRHAGGVVSCDVVANASTRVSKVYGVVEMASESGARKAISQLDGKVLGGRQIHVAEVNVALRQ